MTKGRKENLKMQSLRNNLIYIFLFQQKVIPRSPVFTF